MDSNVHDFLLLFGLRCLFLVVLSLLLSLTFLCVSSVGLLSLFSMVICRVSKS